MKNVIQNDIKTATSGKGYRIGSAGFVSAIINIKKQLRREKTSVDNHHSLVDFN